MVHMVRWFNTLSGYHCHTRTLFIGVYRKPTHMDKYLQWDSYHHIVAKFSAIKTLTQRARAVFLNQNCSEQNV